MAVSQYSRYLREMRTSRLLLLSALLVVLLAQVVAMVMVTRSQVERAAAREALERTTLLAGTQAVPAAAQEPVAAEGFAQVSFATAR